MPSLMQWKGRKFVFILTCVIVITGWVLAYCAVDATTLLVSESIHGFGTNSLIAVSCLTMTEMMSPKYRDTFMHTLYIIQNVGMATEGLLSQYYHWRTISIIMLIPMVISLLVACTLPESPYWLAYKGNFAKCEKNFIWLRGSDAASKRELNELINGPMDNAHSFGIQSVKHFWEKIIDRTFYIPAIHISVLLFLIYGSGSIVTLIYPIAMLQKATGNDQISAYGGFMMNSLLCLGMCFSIVLDKYFNKKPILLCSVICAAICLVTASLFSYFQFVGLWSDKFLVGLFCLCGFMLCSSVGVVGTPYSIAAALMPTKNRGLGGALILINTGIFHTATLKSAPYMFLYLNMWGTYLVYAAVSICCGLLIWRYVPEIKGRNLQEIENYYKYGAYSRVDVDDVDVVTKMILITDCDSEMIGVNT